MALSIYDLRLAQRVVNEQTGSNLRVDGAIGPASQTAIRKWQVQNNLTQTGQIDEKTWGAMATYISQRFVTVEDVANAAKNSGLPASVLLAFWEVESVGAGFLNDGRCTILFEGHKFYEYVTARISQKQALAWNRAYPNLCFPKWDAKSYIGGGGEWRRFEQARALDATCAMLSTSWGLFQLMGFNYNFGGFADVQSMVEAHIATEHNHLNAILNFINTYRISVGGANKMGIRYTSLRDAVVAKDFKAIAAIYNGAGYAANKYDERMKTADAVWARRF